MVTYLYTYANVEVKHDDRSYDRTFLRRALDRLTGLTRTLQESLNNIILIPMQIMDTKQPLRCVVRRHGNRQGNRTVLDTKIFDSFTKVMMVT